MKARKIIRERPANIPADWVIMNAPRPLLGHKSWAGDFVSGIFYAALDPNEMNYGVVLDFNIKQDATILEYVSRQNVVDEMLAYYQARPKSWVGLRLKGYDFSDSYIQDLLIETWFNLNLNWSNDANEETE